jgi:hypothetical protein
VDERRLARDAEGLVELLLGEDLLIEHEQRLRLEVGVEQVRAVGVDRERDLTLLEALDDPAELLEVLDGLRLEVRRGADEVWLVSPVCTVVFRPAERARPKRRS